MAVGEGVAAHVEKHDQVGVERVGCVSQSVCDCGAAGVRIHEQNPLAEEVRHVRLGEHHFTRVRVRIGGQHAVRQPLAALDLVQGARPGLRVDHAPLPGHAAQHRLGTVVDAARLGCGEGSHNVAAPAHAHHKRPAGRGHQRLGIDHAADCALTARSSDSS